MRGIHPGNLLSSGSWEVQFQDIVVEKITIMKSVYVVVDTNYYCAAHSKHYCTHVLAFHIKWPQTEYTVVNS